MLQSIQVVNFRGIRKGQVTDLGRVNILIGPNGSGKSTVLEALELLASAYFPPDILGDDRDQRLRARRHEEGFADGRWYARKTEQEVLLASMSEHGKVVYKFSKDPSGSLRRSQDPQGIPDPSLSSYLRNMLLFDAERALQPKTEQILWGKAFLSKAHKELSHQFESIYGFKGATISFTPQGGLMVDTDPIALRLDDLGAGMRIAFRVLLAALVSENSALLLEEFDAYQYKTSLEKLAESLCSIAERKQVQLFMTTHSLESVHAFLRAAEVQGRPEDWIKVFPLSLSADGVLTTRGMNRGDAQGLLASGLDLRDITSYAKK